MKVKFALPVLVVSSVAAIAFSVRWLQQRQVHHVAIATGSSDGEYYAFAQALATVVARHQPKIRITVVPTKGAQQNQDLLEQKRVELAIVQSDTPPQPSVRAMAYLFQRYST